MFFRKNATKVSKILNLSKFTFRWRQQTRGIKVVELYLFGLWQRYTLVYSQKYKLMKKTFWLLLVFAVISWNACSCPPDEQKGELTLSQSANDFLNYDGSEILVFQNSTGSELSFTAIRGKESAEDKLCYRTTCTEAKYNSPSSCEFYLAESERFSFFSEDDSIVLDLLLYSDVYDYGTADFYDAFQLGFSSGTPSITGHHIIGPRFTGDFDVNTLGEVDFFITEETVELNGKAYTDILVYEESSLAVYIEPGNGVIGFKTLEDTWTIQD